MWKPELVVAEAFDESPGRLVRQLSEALSLPRDDIQFALDHLGLDAESSLPRDLFGLAGHFRIACYLYHGRKLMQHHHPDCARHDRPAIVAAVYSGRLFIYKGAAAFAAEDAKRHPNAAVGAAVVAPRPGVRLQKGERHEPSRDEDCFEEFPWDLDIAHIPAGCYWVQSRCEHGGIEEVVRRFVHSRRLPRLTYGKFQIGQEGETIPRVHALQYTKTALDPDRGEISIRTQSLATTKLLPFCRKLGLKYGGQGMGYVAATAFDRLLRGRNRRYLSDAEKLELRSKQRDSCALCGDTLGEDTQFDHKIALHEAMGEQTTEEFQALCGECHIAKSTREPRAYTGVLRSRFSSRVWEAYVKSPKQPLALFKDEATPDIPAMRHGTDPLVPSNYAVDIRRSRYNALYHCEYLPVFTPLDEIRPVSPEEELPDLIYLEPPPPTTMETICLSLPLAGPMWYPRPVIQYCLHMGVLTWSDLLYGITATGRYPRDNIRQALNEMDHAWGDAWPETGLPEADLIKMRKDMVNAMVGYFGMSTDSETRGLVTYDKDDFRGGHATMTNAYDVPGLLESKWEAPPPPDSGSYKPLYDFCVATERVRVAVVLYALRQAQTLTMTGVSLTPQRLTVDGVFAKRPRKRATMEGIEAVVESFTFRLLSRPREHILSILHC